MWKCMPLHFTLRTTHHLRSSALVFNTRGMRPDPPTLCTTWNSDCTLHACVYNTILTLILCTFQDVLNKSRAYKYYQVWGVHSYSYIGSGKSCIRSKSAIYYCRNTSFLELWIPFNSTSPLTSKETAWQSLTEKWESKSWAPIILQVNLFYYLQNHLQNQRTVSRSSTIVWFCVCVILDPPLTRYKLNFNC